jgi:hypothetical protein
MRIYHRFSYFFYLSPHSRGLPGRETVMESILEHLLTHRYKADLISHMKANAGDFGELVSLAVADKQPYSWRAAWLLWSCMEENDHRLRKHLGDIVNALRSRPDNQVRELLNVLRRMKLSERHEAPLFDACMTIWEATWKPPAVRGNAFIMMLRIAEKHPALKSELALLTEERYMETLTPGVRHSILKRMK